MLIYTDRIARLNETQLTFNENFDPYKHFDETSFDDSLSLSNESPSSAFDDSPSPKKKRVSDDEDNLQPKRVCNENKAFELENQTQLINQKNGIHQEVQKQQDNNEIQMNFDCKFDIELAKIDKTIIEGLEFLDENFDFDRFFSEIQSESGYLSDHLSLFNEMESFYFDDSIHNISQYNIPENNYNFNQLSNKITIF